MTEQALPIGIGQLHPAESSAVYVWNSIEPGQTLVEERVGCREKVCDGAIVLHLALDEQLSLAEEGVAQVVVEVGKDGGIRRHVQQVPQREPLGEEIVDEGSRPRIGKHPAHLPFQDTGKSVAAGISRPSSRR